MSDCSKNSLKKENAPGHTVNTTNTKKCIESMSDEEIIEENLRELLEKKSREERKANGRLVALIIAFFVIFLAIYHTWLRKTSGLAGVLVPAVIMLTYGIWVVVLAKRDKQRRILFEKHLEEIALKNKAELLEKAKQAKIAKANRSKLHYENEIVPTHGKREGHRKQHKNHRRGERSSASGSSSNSSSTTSSHNLDVRSLKQLHSKRPSIRQKLFRQNATTNLLLLPAIGADVPPLLAPLPPSTDAPFTKPNTKKRGIQRLAALSTPQVKRMGSAP